MATELTFVKKGSLYVCKLTDYSQGNIVQVELEGTAMVSANVSIGGGMAPACVGIFENPYGHSVVFSLDIPEGLEVTLTTSSQVKKAAWTN